MTSRSSDFSSGSDIYAHIKHLGYAISRCIRLYGEEFEVVSDPFPEPGGIAVARDHQERLNHSRTADSGESASGCKRAEATLAPSRVESAIVEQKKASMDKSKDQDRGKGAMEQEQQNQGGNTSMPGQLGHRDEDEELKDADADLPG